MEIVQLQAIPVAMDVKPLDEGGIAPYTSNHLSVESVDRMLIRLETSGDITGWGEIRPSLSIQATKTILENDVAQRVVGRSIWEIEQFTNDFLFEYMNINSLVGGVEMAMWDALGKYLEVPIHQLLGGKCVDRVPIASLLGILSPQESRQYARRTLEQGYSVIKLKAGRDWREDVERVIAIHDEVDGRLDIRLDPNQGWTFENAVRTGAKLEDAGVYLEYMEQPIRIDSFGTYSRLRNRLRTPIGVNEDTYFPHHLLHLIKQDAIDVAVVDLVPSGGISALRRLAAVASEYGISLTHHDAFDLGIKKAAVLQTVASTPAINLAVDSVYPSWEDDVLVEPLAVDDGSMEVPDGPGLGVCVDEDKIEQYRID